MLVPPPLGTTCTAVTGHGAYGRALTLPLHQSYHTQLHHEIDYGTTIKSRSPNFTL